MLTNEADELEREIADLVTQAQPQLMALPGVGPISAAQILISWSHPGRLRSAAAFANRAGAARSSPPRSQWFVGRFFSPDRRFLDDLGARDRQ